MGVVIWTNENVFGFSDTHSVTGNCKTRIFQEQLTLMNFTIEPVMKRRPNNENKMFMFPKWRGKSNLYSYTPTIPLTPYSPYNTLL